MSDLNWSEWKRLEKTDEELKKEEKELKEREARAKERGEEVFKKGLGPDEAVKRILELTRTRVLLSAINALGIVVAFYLLMAFSTAYVFAFFCYHPPYFLTHYVLGGVYDFKAGDWSRR